MHLIDWNIALCDCVLHRATGRAGWSTRAGYPADLLTAAQRPAGQDLPKGRGWCQEVCGCHQHSRNIPHRYSAENTIYTSNPLSTFSVYVPLWLYITKSRVRWRMKNIANRYQSVSASFPTNRKATESRSQWMRKEVVTPFMNKFRPPATLWYYNLFY